MSSVPPLSTPDPDGKAEDSLSSEHASEELPANSASLSDAVSGSEDRGSGCLLTSESEGSEYVSTSVSPGGCRLQFAAAIALQQLLCLEGPEHITWNFLILCATYECWVAGAQPQ